MKEDLRRNEIPLRYYEQLPEIVYAALQHPFIPNAVSAQGEELLSNINWLTQEQVRAAMLRESARYHLYPTDEEIPEVSGLYLSDDEIYGRGIAVVPEMFVDDDPVVIKIKGIRIILHEISHGMRKLVSRGLMDVPPGSPSLLWSHEHPSQVLLAHNVYRQELGLSPIAPEDMQAISQGFRTLFIDSEGYLSPLEPYQTAMEEGRTVMVAYVLEALLWGQTVSPYATLVQQLRDGVDTIPEFTNHKRLLRRYIRAAGSTKQGISAFFEDFCGKTLEEFTMSADEDVINDFYVICLKEQERRNES